MVNCDKSGKITDFLIKLQEYFYNFVANCI